MKKIILSSIVLALFFTAGIMLTPATKTASGNTGTFSYDCTHATGNMHAFPSGPNQNTVTITAVVNGVTYTHTGQFPGSSGDVTVTFPSTNAAHTTIVISASWSHSNGVSGTAGPQTVTLDCSRPCPTQTVTITNTVTTYAGTTTVHEASTQFVATTNYSTTTVYAGTTTVTSTVKSKPKIVKVKGPIRWRTAKQLKLCPPPKKPKLTPKEKCAAIDKYIMDVRHSTVHTYIWKNGKCQIEGTG